jgi:hypothetical protein
MLPGLTADEGRDLLLSVGTHHGKRRLSPAEVCERFAKALAAGATVQQCARFVGLSGPTMVSRFLRLSNLDPTIRHLVDWGDRGSALSFASAWQVAELPADVQESVAEAVITNGMTKDEVRELVQLVRRSRRSALDCVAEVLRMRKTVVRRHVIMGAILDHEMQAYLSGLIQLQRDELLARAIHRLYGEGVGIAGRLGTERFTLLATDETAPLVLKRPGGEGFESEINAVLRDLRTHA